MSEFVESIKNTSTTSPAIARLLKHYKWYVIDRISNVESIDTLDVFYKKMLRAKEMNRSRIYENYLVALSKKEINGKTDND